MDKEIEFIRNTVAKLNENETFFLCDGCYALKGGRKMSNYTFAPREYKDLTAYAYVSVSINYVIEINIYVFNDGAESVLD